MRSDIHGSGFLLLMVLLIIWSLVWKGMALWKAARRGERGWFVALLVINAAGILEILYLYVFSNDKIDRTPIKESHKNHQN